MGFLKTTHFRKTSGASGLLLLTGMLFSQVACATDQYGWESGGNHSPQATRHYEHRRNNPVSIEIINDRGRRFAKHQHRNGYKSRRAYLEAKKGQNYKIRVRNRTNKRIAVVIAVDGRNIISGKKSNLQNHERMYVLAPHQSATYKGWRTGKNSVNRFYFTASGDSYAAAWGDRSAMGVIAAAVYEEKPQYQYSPDYYSNKAAPQAKRRSANADEAAGTGYGHEEHSASVRVNFRPKSTVAAKYFYKYEWRDTLCKHNVIQCHSNYYKKPNNRFWPYEEHERGAYAPPPPRYNWR
ncbi:MAG: hypothetical protein V3U84_07960 [Thiotrichaceae bacterium]